MCEEGRKTTCASAKPEWILHRCVYYIVALLELRCAHLLCECSHNDCKSCMYPAQGIATSRQRERGVKITIRLLLCDRDIEFAYKRTSFGKTCSFGYAHDLTLGGAWNTISTRRGTDSRHRDAPTNLINSSLPPIESKCVSADTAAVVITLAVASSCEVQFWYVCCHVIHPSGRQ